MGPRERRSLEVAPTRARHARAPAQPCATQTQTWPSAHRPLRAAARTPAGTDDHEREWLVAFSDDRSTLDDSTAKCRGTSVQYKDGSVGTGCTAATSPHQLSSLSKGRELEGGSELCGSCRCVVPLPQRTIDHRKWRRHHVHGVITSLPPPQRPRPRAPLPSRPRLREHQARRCSRWRPTAAATGPVRTPHKRCLGEKPGRAACRAPR